MVIEQKFCVKLHERRHLIENLKTRGGIVNSNSTWHNGGKQCIRRSPDFKTFLPLHFKIENEIYDYNLLRDSGGLSFSSCCLVFKQIKIKKIIATIENIIMINRNISSQGYGGLQNTKSDYIYLGTSKWIASHHI